jgi:Tfp pilus assembly protein PilX
MSMAKIAHSSTDAQKTGARRHNSRGIALITTLLLLTLMVAMTLGMVIAVTSDTLISGYYMTYRSSFYAGDSGVNIVRQYMLNQLVTNATVAVGASFASNAAPPLSGTDASATLTNTLNLYQASASASNRQINTGQGANSWPGSFYIVQTQAGTPGTTLAAPNCTPVFTPPSAGTGTVAPASGPYDCGANYPTCTGACTNFAITDFQYKFPYAVTAIGQSNGSQQQLVEDSGQLVLDIHVAPSGGVNTAFSAWGMFIDQATQCDGSTLVPGTINGPVFTNGAWNFGTGGSYIFTDKIGSVSPTFGYQFNNNCDSSSSQSDKSGNQTIAPTFQSGVSLGANKIPLPTDSYNQEEAVIDGLGTGCAGSASQCPSKATMNSNLRDINGAAYPLSGASGVFLGYTQTTSGGVTTNNMTGGGILVEGNAAVTLTASTSGSDPVEVYTIAPSSGAATTVTVDITANTTTVKSGAKTTVISGVPANRSGTTAIPATMLYVDGNISALTGPSSGAAIQNGSGITVAAANDITITGNILYKTEPVTMTQNQIPNTPADTLIPGSNNGQVLGIFTANGNVNLNVPTSGQNLEIDASIATISKNGSGGIVNTGNAINTLNIVGGRIQNSIQNINSTTRNVFFDRRFTQGNFAPPWFPSTTVTGAASDSVTSIVPSVQRTQWVSPIS